MTNEDFMDDMEELSSAEDFLNYFNIDFNQHVVHVNRLHILQRFNDYLARNQADMPESADDKFRFHATLLEQSYQDFVNSDAQTEKVFKVFHMNQPQQVFISIDQLKK